MDKKERLRSKKLRVTDFRIAVLEVFERHKAAITHAQIEAELVNFDRITLYRTLKSFREKGIIHEIVLNNNTKKLALSLHEAHSEDIPRQDREHIHFLCSVCDELYCVSPNQFPRVQLEGFAVHQLQIQAYGVCKRCAS